MAETTGGSKGNKSGKKRNSNSAKTYLASGREQINAKRTQARHAKRVKADASKVILVPRGTARSNRRAGL